MNTLFDTLDTTDCQLKHCLRVLVRVAKGMQKDEIVDLREYHATPGRHHNDVRVAAGVECHVYTVNAQNLDDQLLQANPRGEDDALFGFAISQKMGNGDQLGPENVLARRRRRRCDPVQVCDRTFAQRALLRRRHDPVRTRMAEDMATLGHGVRAGAEANGARLLAMRAHPLVEVTAQQLQLLLRLTQLLGQL